MSRSVPPEVRIIPIYSHLPELDDAVASGLKTCAVCVAVYLEACTQHAGFIAQIDQRKAEAMTEERPFVNVIPPSPAELGLLIMPAITENYSWACPDYGKLPVCLSHCAGLRRIPQTEASNSPLYRGRKGETPR